MNMDTIREWLSRQPFHPFLLRLSNGDSYEVRHPENIALAKSKILLGYPETDKAVHVALIHVNAIEELQSA